MSCENLFALHLHWLNERSADPTMVNVVKFQMSEHVFPPVSEAIYGSGTLSLAQPGDGDTLLLATRCLFTTLGPKKGIGELKFYEETVRIFVPNGPIERVEEASGKLVQRYPNFECQGNGSLVSPGKFGILLVTFTDTTEPIPIQ